MNILISRILLYMNSHLSSDAFCIIGNYILKNYTTFENVSLKELLADLDITKSAFTKFIHYFGYETFSDFKEELITYRNKREKQQELRFINLDLNQYYETLSYLIHDETFDMDDLKALILSIVEDIHNSSKIHLLGAIYPLSLAVEFQTHMVSINKQVIMRQNHHRFSHVDLDCDDFVFIFSASGRYITECKQLFGDAYLSLAKKALIIQNQGYNHLDKIDYFIGFPQTHDVFSYNHILVCLLEIIYIEYCHKFGFYK